MLNKKTCLSVLAAVFLMTACADSPEGVVGEAAYQSAVQSGILVETIQTGSESLDTVYDVVAVELRELFRTYEIPARLYAPIHRDLYCERDGGRLKGTYVEIGSRVQKGDVLMEIVFDQNALQAERDQLTLRQRQFEQQTANEDAQRQNAIEQMKNTSAMTEAEAGENEWELQALRLAKLELEYEQFLYNSERTRKDYAKQLTEIEEKMAGEQLIAPFDGIIRFVNNIKEGNMVRNWMRMITIDHDGVLQFTMDGPIDVIRYGDVFKVMNYKNESVNFEVRVVSDPILTDTRLGQYTYIVEPTDRASFEKMLTDNNISLIMLNAMTLTAQPVSFHMAKTLIIPKNAMRQEDNKQYVNIYEDGIIKKRYIQAGMAIQADQQVLDGLEAGQLVLQTY